MTREISLTRGLVALVDDADYAIVAPFKWYASQGRKRYACRATGGRKSRGFVLMHRLLIAATEGQLVDHVNGNGLDNRRENLRLCSYALNGANAGPRGNKHGFKGVTFYRRTQNYTASMQIGGRVIYLGRYPDPETAARAYDGASVAHYGAFAKLNIKDGGQDHPAYLQGAAALARRLHGGWQ